MKVTNKKVKNLLYNSGIASLTIPECELIVEFLVKQDFIESDSLTDPELYAIQATSWVTKGKSPQELFKYASGWGIADWERVIGQKASLTVCRNIIKALDILADEAGSPRIK